MDILAALLSGSVAGLVLAAPLGAIGVLLVREGVTRGLRRGLPGAAAVASVDVLYCTAAVAAGSLAGPIIGNLTPWPQIIGGFAVIAVGVFGLVKSRRPKEPGIDQRTARSGPSSLRRYLVFVGLTALNPATLVYFAAIMTGLDQVTVSPSTSVAFIIGVGVASFGWQSLLVAAGAILRRSAGPSFQWWTTAIGNGLVIVLGVALIAHAL